MARAPETAESDLEATEAECLDCGYTNDSDDVECDSCGGDFLEYHHVSDHALGFDDDDDYKIKAGTWGPTVWVYYAREPT